MNQVPTSPLADDIANVQSEPVLIAVYHETIFTRIATRLGLEYRLTQYKMHTSKTYLYVKNKLNNTKLKTKISMTGLFNCVNIYYKYIHILTKTYTLFYSYGWHI